MYESGIPSVVSSGSSHDRIASHVNAGFEGDMDLETDLPATEKTAGRRGDYSLFSMLPKSEKIRVFFYDGLPVKEMSNTKHVLLSIVLGGAYILYFAAVMIIKTKIEDTDYWCDADGLLIILTTLVGLGLLYFKVLKPLLGKKFTEVVVKPCSRILSPFIHGRFASLIGCLLVAAVIVVVVVVDSWNDQIRLQSLVGMVVLLLLGFLFSAAPRKVRWRHVAWGMALQFLLGLLILRWSVGRAVFQCVAGKVTTFLAFTDKGSSFVFGDLVSEMGIFAFSVLSVILFFSFCVQILYHWGVMQWVVMKLGWVLQVTIGTTACESVNAAANIFLGQTEAPLLIKPYLPLMTKSELHAVMTGGFATIAGSVLAAYISFGIDPAHLLSASVMSAPAALAYAKLFYPETEESRTTASSIQIEKGEETNWLHAAMVGVTNAIPLVANIAANLIAFYAFIALCSHVFDWTCVLAGAEEGQCSLEKRAEIIATYALCGFSNFSSIGINLGGFSAMAPDRKADLAKVVVRAMIAGSAACFLTACVAGTLISELPESQTRTVKYVNYRFYTRY
ncbi:solute carrier family 28 member 3-like isoform X3 [Penaeus chinensis]|uniref:solute carrier family 28 member 3-like isoform X3 n=1 Tax=Penaeus chinensis TaxID=139456 RepID=UPI001FB5CFBC|nr:solute carrier family 28 member 3-like isoform X3 [Penaeus chinensis]